MHGSLPAGRQVCALAGGKSVKSVAGFLVNSRNSCNSWFASWSLKEQEKFVVESFSVVES
jgi:hypothetical protein